MYLKEPDSSLTTSVEASAKRLAAVYGAHITHATWYAYTGLRCVPVGLLPQEYSVMSKEHARTSSRLDRQLVRVGIVDAIHRTELSTPRDMLFAELSKHLLDAAVAEAMFAPADQQERLQDHGFTAEYLATVAKQAFKASAGVLALSQWIVIPKGHNLDTSASWAMFAEFHGDLWPLHKAHIPPEVLQSLAESENLSGLGKPHAAVRILLNGFDVFDSGTIARLNERWDTNGSPYMQAVNSANWQEMVLQARGYNYTAWNYLVWHAARKVYAMRSGAAEPKTCVPQHLCADAQRLLHRLPETLHGGLILTGELS